MTADSRILIVYSTFGDGHLQVANAIRQALEERGVQRIEMVDLLAEAHPWWNAWSRWTYIASSSYCPKLYGLSYDVTNPAKPNPYLSRMFLSIGRRKLREIVDRFRPDAVIHTFPYLAIQRLNAERRFRIPTYTVVTDYVLHSRWVHPETDGYFAATEQVRQMLIRAGVDGSRVAVSGLPIRRAFAEAAEDDRSRLCTELGLDPEKRYALVSAGAYGVLSRVREVAETVLRHSPFDLLMVCGKNAKLYERMKTAFEREPRVHVIGFAERMEAWMAAAASGCVITKAGAVTLTEAMSLGIPAIVYRPLPGQEQGNARVLSERGVIRVADHLRELETHLREVGQTSVREEMSRAMREVFRSGAAGSIAEAVLSSAATLKLRPGNAANRTRGLGARRWRTN